MRAHNFIPILLCCLIIILLYFTLNNSSDKNEQLSDLKLELINGEVLDLSEFQRRPYIIRFFASWCVACKEDGPKLKELSRKMNAPIIGVAVGDSKDKIERLPEEQLPYDYIYIDENNRVKNLLKNRMLPETIIIDVDGNIAVQHIGSL